MGEVVLKSTVPAGETASEIRRLKDTVSKLETEVSRLHKQLEWFQRQVFGVKSERFIDPGAMFPDLPGFEFSEDPKEESEAVTVPEHERKPKSRKGEYAIDLPDDLPRETRVVDIPEKEKVCPETGEKLIEIGRDVTEKLAVSPEHFFVVRIERPKYAKKGDALFGVVQEPAPETILEGSKFDPSFMAHVIAEKYGRHIPLNRIHEQLSYQGIKISEQTLCNLVINLGLKIQPLIDRMNEKLFEDGVLFTDDTSLKMIVKGNGKAKQSYMWIYLNGKPNAPPYHIYEFTEGRSHRYPREFLNQFNGIIHGDAFPEYEKLDKDSDSGITWAPCWAHARRRFFDLHASSSIRKEVLRLMRNLFRFESVAWASNSERRLEIRRSKEKPIVEKLFEFLKDKIRNSEILPKSDVAEAIGYMISREEQFKRYLDNPDIRMDNNRAESALRKVVIGRKNWLYVGSERSGKAAANLFSLVQTCRALKINPQKYLEDIFTRLMAHPAKKIDELLPDQWAKPVDK